MIYFEFFNLILYLEEKKSQVKSKYKQLGANLGGLA